MTITNNILTDIDECAQDTHNCSKENALCHNSEGSFNCTCKPGLSGDGHNCTGTEIMLVVIFRRKPIFSKKSGWQPYLVHGDNNKQHSYRYRRVCTGYPQLQRGKCFVS